MGGGIGPRTAQALSAVFAALLLQSTIAGGHSGASDLESGPPAASSAASERRSPDSTFTSSAVAGPSPIFNFLDVESLAVDPRTGHLFVANGRWARITVYDPQAAKVLGFVDGVSGQMAFDRTAGS